MTSVVTPVLTCYSQRDYFGAHTFRVLPGAENERLPTGKDIRESDINMLRTFGLPCALLRNTDINWTGRGGNVSASSYIV